MKGGAEMKTVLVEAEVSADRKLRLEVPCDLSPGRVEVLLTIATPDDAPLGDRIDWSHLSGLGRDVWQGVDAASYLDDLRADREPRP
jgi:hypothetical protein